MPRRSASTGRRPSTSAKRTDPASTDNCHKAASAAFVGVIPSGPSKVASALDEAAAADGGPVLTTVEYEIDPPDAAAFGVAMEAMGRARRRDGAFFWQVFTDAGDPRRRVEAFMLEDRLAHLRRHERVTVEDRRVQERVRALHRGGSRPRVTRLVAGRRQASA